MWALPEGGQGFENVCRSPADPTRVSDGNRRGGNQMPHNNAMHLTVNSRLRRLLPAGDRER